MSANQRRGSIVRNFIFRAGRFLSVITTLLALVGVASSVQAASFRKGWDPLFNIDFSTTLGWRGEAVIFVDDDCVIGSSTQAFPGNSCGSANLESYLLEFYNINNPLVILDSASDSAPGSPAFPAVSAVSFDSESIADGVSLLTPIEVSGSFSFTGYESSFTAFITFGLDSTSLKLQESNCEGECTSFLSTIEPTVEWSRVPVPATLALFGIGLAGLGWSRRKKL
jgi:hypothetical protein